MTEARPSLNGLPFHLKNDGGARFLEYTGDFGGGYRTVCYLYDHEPMFSPVVRLMKQYRDLEQKLRDVEKERDDALAAVETQKAVVAHKDKVMAGYEAQIGRSKKTREHQ